MNELTQSYLKKVLTYCPDTGIFINNKTGKQVGWYQSGYLKYEVEKKKYYLHRLAYLYMTGNWPQDEVDHINNIRDDNRWDNLREATRIQNRCNSPVRCDSSTGLKGVEYVPKIKKYRALITHNKQKKRLGTFKTAHEASKAYEEEARKIQGEYRWAETH